MVASTHDIFEIPCFSEPTTLTIVQKNLKIPKNAAKTAETFREMYHTLNRINMKAIDIIKALSYCKPEDGDGVIEYDSETSWTKDSNDFLNHYFGLGKPVSGEFTSGTWYYVFNEELTWPNYRERVEKHLQTEPDVMLEESNDYNTAHPTTTVYLYKIDD